MYEKDTLSALDAITEAQRIAFARCYSRLRFVCVTQAFSPGSINKEKRASLEEITEHSTLGSYGVSVLLDMGLSGRIVTQQNGRYFLAKVGHFYCTTK